MFSCPKCGTEYSDDLMVNICPACGTSLLDEDAQPVNLAFNAKRKAERSLDELIGMGKMALMDGVISQSEAEYIFNWMQDNADVAGFWPGDVLFHRLARMLSDRKLDPEEQRELLELLQELTGSNLKAFGERNMSASLPLDQPQPKIAFNQSIFCFTGKFVFGTRRCCEESIVCLGGVPVSAINKKLNYLVIGSIGSTDWIHSTHGRKIEQAVEYRDSGCPLAIVSEQHWIECIQASL